MNESKLFQQCIVNIGYLIIKVLDNGVANRPDLENNAHSGYEEEE